MTWNFGSPFISSTQYFRSFSNFSTPTFHSHFNSQPLLSSMPPSFFDYTRSFHQLLPKLNHCEMQPMLSGPISSYSQKVCVIRDNREGIQKTNFILKQNQSSEKSQQVKGEIRMVRFRRRRAVSKPKNLISHNSSLRNDTKNIPKNYGKAMLSYIQKNTRQVKQLINKYNVQFVEFMMVVKSFKSKINTIHDLRQMWGQNETQDKIKACIRILSYYFMRKKCLPYIFNSRVKNHHTHIKYRKKIMQGIENPQNFTKIKQF